MKSRIQSSPTKPIALWVPSVFIVAALGPYLGSSGLKLEHLVIYGTVFAYGLWTFPDIHFRPWANFSPMMNLWLCLSICQLFGLLWSSSLARRAPPTWRLLAAVEHQIQPLVVVGVICALAGTLSSKQLGIALRRALNVLVWGLIINTILIIWFMRTETTALFLPWLPPSTGADPDSVWSLSVEMGRLGGIFNQPFEAGLGYSLGLLGWCRIQGDRKQAVYWEYGRLVLLLFGGLVSVSKVFIFGGIPLFLILCFKRYRKYIFNLKSCVVLIGFILAASYFQEFWNGFSYFMRLFTPEKGIDLLDLYTSNRFGGDPTMVTDYFAEVWKMSPLFGFGFAPLDIMDNGFLWAFASGGILGLSIFVLMLYRALSWARKLMRENSEQMVPFVMLSLMVLAAIGAPSLTIDRASTIFWTLYPLVTLVGLSQYPREAVLANSSIRVYSGPQNTLQSGL